MIDDQLILQIERFRDELKEFKTTLSKQYHKTRPVTSDSLRSQAAELAESWLVKIAQNQDIVKKIDNNYIADLTVNFQRLLSFSEHATKRSRYDSEIKAILKQFTIDFVVPLKQLSKRQHVVEARVEVATPPVVSMLGASDNAVVTFAPTAFVGHSFEMADEAINNCIIQSLESLGISVVTGKKPRADKISDKVKQLIEGQYLFVGIFTRKDKIARKNEWTTSSWVIDEKAYAVGKGKKLLLFKERGVGSIGGIQGDYEYSEFTRDQLDKVVLNIIEVFEISLVGLK